MKDLIVKFDYHSLRNEAHAEYHDTLAATIARHTAAAKRQKRRRSAVCAPCSVVLCVSSVFLRVIKITQSFTEETQRTTEKKH